jgi:hypothetical protein
MVSGRLDYLEVQNICPISDFEPELRNELMRLL